MLPETILKLFGKPEYFHLLLNSVPTHGLALGALALCLAFFTKSSAARFVALSIICFSSLMAYPVFELGEAASDKIAAIADDEGSAWLEEHERRAQKVVWLFYVLAGVSAVSIAAQRKSDRAGVTSAAVTFALTLLVMGAGGYVAYAGGKIAHPTIRVESPPAMKITGLVDQVPRQ